MTSFTVNNSKSDQKICRLCLGHSAVCYSLLEDPVRDMLEALTSIKVNASDNFSTVTCMKCLLNIKLAFNIRANILKADKKLREKTLSSQVEVKEETLNEEFIIKNESENNTNNLLKLSGPSCVICAKSVKEDLDKHIREHFNKQLCDVCNESFSNISEYWQHFTQEHSQSSNYSCANCGATFRYKSLYHVHLKQAHGVSVSQTETVRLFLESTVKEGPFTCGVCGKKYVTRRQFTNHSHEKKPCPICKAEISKTNHRKHVMNHSSGPQVCHLCGATLRSLESLRGHMSHTHKNYNLTCPDCGKTFKKRYSYQIHRKRHIGEKCHICETCGKSFMTFHFMNKHIKSAHLKLRPYICQYCKRGFSSKFAMRTHVRQHTNETPYKCEVCGEGFRQNVSLRAHRKSKHNIIEPKNVECKVCGKKFGCEQAIISHMRLH